MQDLLVVPLTQKNRRPENQDAFGYFDTAYGPLFIVCDGFGAKGGRWAAWQAVSAYPRLLDQAHEKGMDPRSALQAVTRAIHSRIAAKNTDPQSPHQDSGTTVVLGLKTPQGMIIGHVGDSRAYLVEASGVTALTRDHNKVSEMLDEGKLSFAQARAHPQAHVLTRALGSQAPTELEIQATPIELLYGQGLLFCTDGLCGFLDHASIAACIKAARDPQQVPKDLARLAMEQGSDDNITILYTARAPQQKKAELPIMPPAPAAKPAPQQQPQLEFPSPKHPSKNKPDPKPTLKPGYTGPAPKQPTVIEEKPIIPSWLYAAGLLVALLFTWIHYSMLWDFKTYQYYATETTVPQTRLTDIEESTDYDWQEEECSNTLVGQARAIASDFERELRDAGALSSQDEIEMGDQFAEELAQHFGDKLDQDLVWLNYIRKLGAEVAQHATRQDITYTFHYVDDDVVNAFAMPGGHIYVFRGVLEKIVENEAMLAFLLSHEITHVELKHCVALMQIMEYVPGMNANVQAMLTKILTHPFSVEYEQEADRGALQIIMKTSYSPFQGARTMIRFGELRGYNMEEESRPEGFLQAMMEEAKSALDTHPNPKLRLCLYKNLILENLKRETQPFYYVGKANYNAKLTMKEKTF